MIHLGQTLATAEPGVRKESEDTVRHVYLGYLFLINSNRSRFGDLNNNLSNDYLMNQNNYPASLTDAYNMLVNYRSQYKNPTSGTAGNESVAFVADGRGDPSDQDAGEHEETALVATERQQFVTNKKSQKGPEKRI